MPLSIKWLKVRSTFHDAQLEHQTQGRLFISRATCARVARILFLSLQRSEANFDREQLSWLILWLDGVETSV